MQANSNSWVPCSALQEDLEATKDKFRDTWGDNPKKDELTVLVPKQDDPTQQIFIFYPEETKVTAWLA